MVAVVAAGLFISLFVALYILLTPPHEHDVSPARAAVDVVKRRLTSRLAGGEKGEILALLGRNVRDVLKLSLLIGSGLSFLVFVVTAKFLGAFALVLAVATGVLSIFLVEKAIENEYKKWRARLLEGMPSLVGFFPAFLEVEGVTPREALEHTVPFLPEPLRSEVQSVLTSIRFKGRVSEAVAPLVRRAKDSLVDAVCLRLSAAWDAGMGPEVFADLSDQVEQLKKLAAARATAAKTGYLALVCVLGLIGMMLVFGYPGFKFLMEKLTAGFGIT